MNELRRLYLEWKSATGGTQEDLSIRAGVPIATLRRALSPRDDGGSVKADTYLKIKKALAGTAATTAVAPTDASAPESLLAKDLRTLADILEGDYPKDFKAKKFTAWIKVAYESLADLASTITKDIPDD